MKLRSFAMAVFCAAASTVLSGCNGIGNRDYLVARLNSESLYREDLTMLEINFPKSNEDWAYQVYKNLYSKAVVTSIAVKEYPEIESDWEQYFKDLEPRVLMMIFQRFFVSENLMFSDSELRRFYDANRNLFPADSLGDFYKVRAEVAERYYLEKNAEAFEKFKKILPENDKAGEDSMVLEKRFVEQARQRMQYESSTGIMEKQHISIQNLPPVDPKAYYEKFKDQYMTVPGYVLYHVQSSDSLALATKIRDDMNLETFKVIASNLSQNSFTAKDSGYVGMVKKDYALPYGIGLIQELSGTLENKNPGFITPVLRSAREPVYHRFFLTENVPSQVKPYERVEKAVLNDAASGEIFGVDSSFALILKDGKPIFTEADLIRFNKLFFGNRKMNMNSHSRAVAMIAETYAFANAAIEQKLNNSWEYRSIVRSTRWNYISDHYIEKKWGAELVPEDTLKSLYERFGSPIHIGYDYEQAKDDLRRIAVFPKNVVLRDYYLGYRMIYYKQSFEEVLPKVVLKREDNIKKLFESRIATELYNSASIHFYDSSLPEYETSWALDKSMSRADSLYKNGKNSDAYNEYYRILLTYADDDELFQKVAYELALVQNDNAEYDDAEAEYYAFYRMWPENKNAEKAMFSRGFILTENLGKDSLALEVFREFLAKYPNSELRESADWLVKNIESNGKLAEDLLQKINTEQ